MSVFGTESSLTSGSKPSSEDQLNIEAHFSTSNKQSRCCIVLQKSWNKPRAIQYHDVLQNNVGFIRIKAMRNLVLFKFWEIITQYLKTIFCLSADFLLHFVSINSLLISSN